MIKNSATSNEDVLKEIPISTEKPSQVPPKPFWQNGSLLSVGLSADISSLVLSRLPTVKALEEKK